MQPNIDIHVIPLYTKYFFQFHLVKICFHFDINVSFSGSQCPKLLNLKSLT